MNIEEYGTSTEVNIFNYAFFSDVCQKNIGVFFIFFITNYDDYYKVCFWFSLLHRLLIQYGRVFKETGNNHIKEFVRLIKS